MGYKLFLDDMRNPGEVLVRDADPKSIICRSYYDFAYCIVKNGLPDHIYFDHDLGNELGNFVTRNGKCEYRNGLDCCKFLGEYMERQDLKFPTNFTFSVHSANPVGAQNIKDEMAYLLRIYGNED